MVIDDEPTNRLREQVQQIVTDIDPQLSMHDFRAVFGPTHTNLVFDIAVPPSFSLSDSELEQLIERRAKEMGATSVSSPSTTITLIFRTIKRSMVAAFRAYFVL